MEIKDEKEILSQGIKQEEQKKIEELIETIKTPTTPTAVIVDIMDHEGISKMKVRESKCTTEKVKMLYEEYGISPAFFEKKYFIHKSEEWVDFTIHYGGFVTREYQYASKLRFRTHEESTLEEKQECKETEERLEKIKNSKDEKYDKPGKIILHRDGKDISVIMTQRELAQAGILPEDFKWTKTKERLSKKDIANADNAYRISETDLAPIKNHGFIDWIRNVKARLTKVISGKDEK